MGFRKCCLSLYAFGLVCNVAYCLLNDRDPLVTIKQGKLKGFTANLFDGTPYYSFKGIPYAEVPARFSAPIPPSSWPGVRDATTHGPVCTQYRQESGEYIGEENCLFVNVYTKTLRDDAKLPVMVYIHGGSFMYFSGNTERAGYGAEWLIQHDVILVTMNYRLEVLGFMSLDTPEAPGNAAMKDQTAALRWVQQNIARFGGDPNCVTLFGESSGSASVAYHIQSPMSRGLFHKAILHSGTNIDDWAQGRNENDAKSRAFRVAKLLGNNSTDTTEVLNFLKRVPAYDLVHLTNITMTKDERNRGLPVHFVPVVEKRFKGVKAFIAEEPLDTLIKGNITNKVPLMLGYNSDEAMLMLADAFGRLDFANKNLQYLVPREIAENLSVEKQKKLGEKIRKFYVGDRDFNNDDGRALSDMLSDLHFVYSTHRYANFYSSLAPTYLFRFSLDTELNIIKILSGYSNMTGASHADDLFYLFNNEFNKDLYEQNTRLRDVVFKFTKLWTDFAKTGNPTPDSRGVKWLPHTSSERAYFEINETFTTGQDVNKARVEFWDKIYCEAGLPCISKS